LPLTKELQTEDDLPGAFSGAALVTGLHAISPTNGVRLPHSMTTAELLEFMRTQRLAVEASVAPGGETQAALIGVGVTDALELVFDTVETTRKCVNLRRNPHLAFVIGGWADGDERTVQYEGIADEPRSDELARIKKAYFAMWPDGPSREVWPGIVYVRVRPTWIRYSDFNQNPPVIVEFDQQQLDSS
jgi:Pyridoxamine 5'-phosphate oxidase